MGDRTKPSRDPAELAAVTHFNDRMSPDQLNAEMERLARYIGKASDRFGVLREHMDAVGLRRGDAMRELSDALHGCRGLIRYVGYPVPGDEETAGG